MENEKLSTLKKAYGIAILNGLCESKGDFAELLGINRATLSAAFNGSERYLTDSLINKVVSYMNSKGYDIMLRTDSEGTMLKDAAPLATPTDSEDGIPLIPIETMAGFPTVDAEGVRLEDCQRYYVPEFKERGADFCIRISGDSMMPTFHSGDIVVCKKIEEVLFLQWGKVYIFDTSQGQLCKRLFECTTDDNCVICVSDNKEMYPQFKMPKNDIRSLSIVLGLIRID